MEGAYIQNYNLKNKVLFARQKDTVLQIVVLDIRPFYFARQSWSLV
jgi:hypothetical protein